MLLYFGAEKAWEETLWSSQGRWIKVLPAFDAQRIVGVGRKRSPTGQSKEVMQLKSWPRGWRESQELQGKKVGS